MAVVVFDYDGWILRYPEFAETVGAGLAQLYFNEATLYLANTDAGAVSDDTRRSVILGQLTAHIAKLNAPDADGQSPSALVGRISSASQGSVNVSADYETPGSAAWFNQTRYGAAAYQALASYRTFRYHLKPRMVWPWRRF